jgi:DNA recombination protein RmuC
MNSTAVLLLLLGLAAGFAAGLLVAARRLPSGPAADREAHLLELADARFREAGARTAADVEARRAAVERLVSPLADTLGRVETRLAELERARVAAYSGLVEQVRSVGETSERLRRETSALVGALRAPQARGRWGEVQLRRLVELAGMLEHSDFSEQPTVLDGDSTRRPDLVVHLAGGKHVVIDAKVPLGAYLEAIDSDDDADRAAGLEAHAKALRSHVDALAAKEYWRLLQPCPELVVLFVPGEAFLAPALEHDPGLLEHAMSRRVVVATPTTLVAMLRTIAYAWQQQALTDNAREVFELGRELYTRLGRLGGHVDKLGRSLQRAVADYNGAVGSLERQVLPQARRFAALRVTDAELTSPTPIEETARGLTAGELLEDVERAATLRVVGDSDR